MHLLTAAPGALLIAAACLAGGAPARAQVAVDADPFAPTLQTDPSQPPRFKKVTPQTSAQRQKQDQQFQSLAPPPSGAGTTGFDSTNTPKAKKKRKRTTSNSDQTTIAPALPAAWTATVPLDHPLLVDGQTLAAISMRRPTGADVAELMELDPTEATLPTRLRAWICGVHPAVFAALAADDSERVAEALRPFLPRAILAIEEDLAQEAASEG